MKLKVGDTIKVRPDLKRGERYGLPYVIREMLELAGTTSKITAVNEAYKAYIIEGNHYFWTDEMLELVAVSTPEYEVFDQVHAFVTTIERVIYKEPATIVFYSQDIYTKDGQPITKGKTRKMVTKCLPEDTYDKKKGLKIALLKITRKESDRLLKMF